MFMALTIETIPDNSGLLRIFSEKIEDQLLFLFATAKSSFCSVGLSLKIVRENISFLFLFFKPRVLNRMDVKVH